MSTPTTQLSPITVAIIGGGLIGPRHAQSLLNNQLTTLVALVDPAPHGPTVAQALSTSYYPSIKTLLASPDRPTVAIVCTPNHTHVDISRQLITAGVNVLVEKPISSDIASAMSLVALAKQHNIRLLVGHHRRFNPYITKTKKLINSNVLGRIVAVNGLWTTYKPPSYYLPPTEWRQTSSGGVVFINLVHEIDLMHYLFGRIVRVHAEEAIRHREYEADEGVALILRFESGVIGTFLVSDATPSPHNFESGTGENPTIPKSGKDFYRIFGTEGCLSVPEMTLSSYKGREQKSWTETMSVENTVVDESIIPFDAQLENLARVLRGEEKAVCDGEEGVRALIVCEAIRRAMKGCGTVDIDNLEAEFNISNNAGA